MTGASSSYRHPFAICERRTYHAFVSVTPTSAGARWTRLILTGLVVLFTATACIGRLGRSTDPYAERRGEGPGGELRVAVQNLNFNELTIFAIRQGNRIRLGTVGGKSDGFFTLDWDYAMQVQFRIDIVGGRGCSIGRVNADPGAEILVQVPANIGMTPCRASRR